jgi:hypothetical protein
MSKFTEEWQATKKALGHMVGVMESMAAKYGECADIEEKAKKKGFTEGYNLGIKKQKAEICENCYHKETAENVCQYAGFLNLVSKLSETQRRLINDIVAEMLSERWGGN